MRVELCSSPLKISRRKFDLSGVEASTFEEDLSETSSFVDFSEIEDVFHKPSSLSLRKEIIGGQIKPSFVRDESNIVWNSDARFTVEIQIGIFISSSFSFFFFTFFFFFSPSQCS